MIYSVTGTLREVRGATLVLEVGPVCLAVHTDEHTRNGLAASAGTPVTLRTHLHTYEGGMDLYGFPTPEKLALFESLISISGVGPRSALAVLAVGTLDELHAAIVSRRPDLLSRAPGIGKKTAERIVVELSDRVKTGDAEGTVARIEEDTDIVEALASLGYRKDEARRALERVDAKLSTKERLKLALRSLGGKR